jgi:hypothetical protein
VRVVVHDDTSIRAVSPLMMGMSLIGVATVATNLRFLLDRAPPLGGQLVGREVAPR